MIKNKILLFAFAFVFLVLISANGVNALVGEDTHNYTLGSVGSAGANQTAGVRIFTNQSFLLTTVNKTSASDPNIVYLMNDTNHILATASYASNGVATFNYLIPANFYFKLASTNTTGGWNIALNDSTSRPLLRSKVVTWANGTFRNETDGQPTYSGTPNYFSVITSIGFDTAPIFANNNSYNASTFQTARESFVSNYNMTNVSSAILVYNSQNYTGTVTASSGNTTYLSASIDIPASTSGATNWNWFVTFINGTSVSTTAVSQTVTSIDFNICSGSGVRYLNFTFIDESTLSAINGSIQSSSINYWLGGGGSNKTLSYSNTSLTNPSYGFCFTPSSRRLYADISSLVYSFTGYPQRTYSNNSLYLNGTSTNIPLYLLSSSVGIYTSFQIIAPSQTPISGATVSVYKNGIIIEERETDDSGIATFWVDPNSQYTIIVVKEGYTTYTASINPTQTSYTIIMGEISNSTAVDLMRGIKYSFAPNVIELNNNTLYQFNFTIASNYWGLGSYGFILKNSSGSILNSSSDSQITGSTVSAFFNTGNLSYIEMSYFYFTNGSYVNGSHIWTIVNTVDSSWSISHFFTDLNNYLSDSNDPDGLFGLKKGTSSGNFSLAIVIFIIIFSFAGIMSYQYGLTSTSAIIFLMTSAVMFFDVGLGLIPNPFNAIVPNFATFFMVLVLIIVMLREAQN